MEAKLIDLDDYVLSGEGANGQSYDCLRDSAMMVKLYSPGYDRGAIITELETAKKVFAMGVPSPKPGGLVTDGTRLGICFNRVVGKRSFARAIADEPERVEEFVSEFALTCKQLHTVECPEGSFPDAKEDFLRLLGGNSFLGHETCEAIKRFIINEIPSCRSVLHGDMHLGNVLITLPKGHPMSEPHAVCFIDLGYFGQGYPLLDLGMMDSICVYSDDSFLEHDFHFGRKVALKAWDSFVDTYFFGPERLADKYFGEGASVEDVNEGMIPYAIVKLLLVGYNLGFMPEGYMRLIQGNLYRL